MKKIKGCQVSDFHLSMFVQSKKMIKIHTNTPIFLHHIAVAQTFFKKKISSLDGDVWLWEIKKKTRKKQKLRNELFKGLRLNGVNLSSKEMWSID